VVLRVAARRGLRRIFLATRDVLSGDSGEALNNVLIFARGQAEAAYLKELKKNPPEERWEASTNVIGTHAQLT
jgi:hypothetical protein